MAEKQLEKGAFVLDLKHVDYGVGRVLDVGSFAARVLFVRGGLRVFRVADAQKLKVTSQPALEEIQALVEKEALLTRGLLEPASGPAKEAAPPAKAKRAAKKKVAAGGSSTTTDGAKASR